LLVRQAAAFAAVLPVAVDVAIGHGSLLSAYGLATPPPRRAVLHHHGQHFTPRGPNRTSCRGCGYGAKDCRKRTPGSGTRWPRPGAPAGGPARSAGRRGGGPRPARRRGGRGGRRGSSRGG